MQWVKRIVMGGGGGGGGGVKVCKPSQTFLICRIVELWHQEQTKNGGRGAPSCKREASVSLTYSYVQLNGPELEWTWWTFVYNK